MTPFEVLELSACGIEGIVHGNVWVIAVVAVDRNFSASDFDIQADHEQLALVLMVRRLFDHRPAVHDVMVKMHKFGGPFANSGLQRRRSGHAMKCDLKRNFHRFIPSVGPAPVHTDHISLAIVGRCQVALEGVLQCMAYEPREMH